MITCKEDAVSVAYYGTPRTGSTEHVNVVILKYKRSRSKRAYVYRDGALTYRGTISSAKAKALLWTFCAEDGETLPKWL